MGDEFVGSGFAFPLRLDASGSFALVSREREIEEAIRIVVGTAPGERPLRPDFGCRVHDHVFAPADATTEGLIAADVLEALERWEPRIQVAEVDVAPDEDDPSLLYIDVRYTIQGSNDPRNLVFPFYVIPGEGESDLLALPAADWEA
jgi:phage baseplate assembly protein W